MQLSNALTQDTLLVCIRCCTVLSFWAELQANYKFQKVHEIVGFEYEVVIQGAHDAVLGMPALLWVTGC